MAFLSESTVLTVAIIHFAQTVKVMPLQIMTGLYGMNFVDEEGDTAIPILKMKHGYLYFWLFTAFMYGAHFSTEIYTRGCHWIPRMFA
jgi:Mg2+ and Co2+ transporter CorA